MRVLNSLPALQALVLLTEFLDLREFLFVALLVVSMFSDGVPDVVQVRVGVLDELRNHRVTKLV